MNSFTFENIKKSVDIGIREGIIHTPHGDIQTPCFIPVGTQGTVKSLTPDEIKAVGTQMFFVNSYHAYLRPGVDIYKACGGLHSFIGWDRPIITDSGGFQAFSLAKNTYSGHKTSDSDVSGVLAQVGEDGVTFRSHWDGSKHVFSPEFAMQLQWDLGSDIHIAFDDCTPFPVTYDKAKISMERTHRWALRSIEEHTKIAHQRTSSGAMYQALYGSIQGSVFEDLRKESAAYISSLPVDGIAIGGVSVGESKGQMKDVLEWVCPLLPEEKPRHLLGVGEIDDIFELLEHGVDTFDCVQPTRLARMGQLYNLYDSSRANTSGFTLDITKSVFAADKTPIDSSCRCYACMHTSRAYLHHLFHVHELLAYRLATLHNVHTIHMLVKNILESVHTHTYFDFKKKILGTSLISSVA